MSPDEVPVPSRRERRVQTGALSTAPEPAEDAAAEVADTGALTIGAVPLADAPTAVAPTVPVFEPVADSPTVPTFEPVADSPTAPTFEPAADTMSSLIPGLAPEEPQAAPVVTGPVVAGARTALAWVDETAITQSVAPGDLSAAATPYVTVENDLLAHPPRRSPLRAGVVVPTLIVAGVIGAYAGTTLLWPLHAVEPTITAIEAQPVAAPAAVPAWPAAGSAAEAVGGISGTLASTADADSIASITKVVTALLVLDQLPLAPGEQGPEYHFTAADRASYWQYRRGGESALDVPVGGSLTEYQMLQGMLIGSANNYADRLAQGLWPSDAVFASAASAWLSTHGVPGVTVYEPTGMNKRNTATPEALVTLAQKALANPVIAEIVATAAVDLPGAGHVVNTNELLADPGVVGVKTGTLDAWNLLSAKDITVGDTTVRLFASVLGQPDDDARLAASRAIYTQLEQELQLKPSVTADTVVGIVETRWGDKVDIVTAGDASVILWNGGTGTVGTTFDLGDSRGAGDPVGTLTVTGPLDDTTVDLKLAADVSDPSPLWRLTHPLDLFGLNG